MVLNSVLVVAATSPASLPLTLGLIAQPLIQLAEQLSERLGDANDSSSPDDAL